MFDSNGKEAQEGRLKITNFTYEVISEMLRFLYTAQAPNIYRLSTKLQAASEYVSKIFSARNMSLNFFLLFMQNKLVHKFRQTALYYVVTCCMTMHATNMTCKRCTAGLLINILINVIYFLLILTYFDYTRYLEK